MSYFLEIDIPNKNQESMRDMARQLMVNVKNIKVVHIIRDDHDLLAEVEGSNPKEVIQEIKSKVKEIEYIQPLHI